MGERAPVHVSELQGLPGHRSALRALALDGRQWVGQLSHGSLEDPHRYIYVYACVCDVCIYICICIHLGSYVHMRTCIHTHVRRETKRAREKDKERQAERGKVTDRKRVSE